METQHLQAAWQKLGTSDPLWSILTDPTKRGNRWELAEFWATGVTEIATVMSRVAQLWPDLSRTSALDFGCGVGRLSQALAGYFRTVHGVDIASSMIDHARNYNRFPDRVYYSVNTDPNLNCFADQSFDFIYSNIVLQHMPPSLAFGYIRDFLRVVRPQGLLVFQLPSRRIRDWRKLPTWRKRLLHTAPNWLINAYGRMKDGMEMHTVPRRRIEEFLHAQGTHVLHVEQNELAGMYFQNCCYYVARA